MRIALALCGLVVALQPLVAGEVARFPAGELGFDERSWQQELDRAFQQEWFAWGGCVLLSSKTLDDAEVYVERGDDPDSVRMATETGDIKTLDDRKLKDVHVRDRVEILFEVMGEETPENAAVVAHKLLGMRDKEGAELALARTMRACPDDRELMSRVASALLNREEPEGGFYAIPMPLSVVDKGAYDGYVAQLKLSFDTLVADAQALLKKKLYTTARIKLSGAIGYTQDLALTKEQAAGYEAVIKAYDEAVVSLDKAVEPVSSAADFKTLRKTLVAARDAAGKDAYFARRLAQVAAFKHDEISGRTDEWLEDGRDFRSTIISWMRAFADAKEDDGWLNKKFFRRLVGKMYAYKAYQDYMEEIIDAATRNARSALQYAPADPLCIAVDKAAKRLKKDKIKELNAPARFEGDSIWRMAPKVQPRPFLHRPSSLEDRQ